MSCEIINGKTVLILIDEDLATGTLLSGYHLLWKPSTPARREQDPYLLLREEIRRRTSFY